MALEGERRAEIVLAACTENPHYDRQCEENRAPYFMRLLELAGLKERAREAILRALPRAEDEYDRDWMVDLLEVLASNGDRVAWEVLRGLATGGYVRAQNNLATMDEAGLQWVVDNVLPTLPEEDRWRVGMWLPDEESDDETPLQKSLREMDRTWNAEIAARSRNFRTAERPSSAREFLNSLDDPRLWLSPYSFRGVASPDERLEAAERLLAETGRRKALHIVRALRGSPCPLPLARLLPHATHKSRGMAVRRLLGEIDAPEIRELALSFLRQRPILEDSLRVLTASFRKGDETLVLEALPNVEDYDDEHRHGLILGLTGLFRGHPNADWQHHAEWVYEHSPCSMCRASAFDWLAESGIVTIRFLEEAPYDAEPRIREAAEAFHRQN